MPTGQVLWRQLLRFWRAGFLKASIHAGAGTAKLLRGGRSPRPGIKQVADTPGVDLFLLTNKVQRMNDDSLFALILAAGAAKRYGSTKQLATYGGQALVARAVRLAESICGSRTLLVVGNEHHAVTAACQPQRGFFVYNPNFADGIAGSIRSGIRCLPDQAEGVLLLLADQPLIEGSHLASLEEAWRTAPDNIIASGYANTLGPPAIFPRALFTALLSLRGDRGAKSLFAAYRDRLKSIAHDSGAVDVDVPADLERLRN